MVGQDASEFMRQCRVNSTECVVNVMNESEVFSGKAIS